jgi:hypothetical protein
MGKKNLITIDKNPDYGTYEVYCNSHGEWNGGYETMKEAREAKAAPHVWCLGHGKEFHSKLSGEQFNG